MSKKNLTWGPNTSSYSSGINHGYQDSTQGKKVQQLANSAQVMFGKTGDPRYLPYTGDAPSAEESMNLIENSGREWGGKKTKRAYKKTKRAYKKTKRAYKKTKRAHKKKIHRKH